MDLGGLGVVPLEDPAEVLQGGAGGQGAGPKALPVLRGYRGWSPLGA